MGTPQSHLKPGAWRLVSICDMGPGKNSIGRIIRGKPASAISGDPDIFCFLLLDDLANELFLSAGLGSDRILNTEQPRPRLPLLFLSILAPCPRIGRREFLPGVQSADDLKL
jgi:hypothetical protein